MYIFSLIILQYKKMKLSCVTACFIFQTEYEGQVKKYLAALEKGEADAVVVAGGDGTLLEVR